MPFCRAATPKERHIGIHAFTSTSKPGVPNSGSQKSSAKIGINLAQDSLSRKRKACPDLESSTRKSVNKRLCRDFDVARDKSTPTERRRNTEGLPTPEKTPTELCPSSRGDSQCQPLQRSLITTLAATSTLLALHNALLRALSLHFAHHGTSSPVRLSDLLPSASKIWGVRHIKLEDVQRCLIFYSQDEPILRVFDYGKSGLCLELEASATQGPRQGRAVLAQVLDEELLQAEFLKNLETAWHDWYSSKDNESEEQQLCTTAETFIANLPLTKIPPHPSLLKSRTTSSSLGQRRLESLLRTPQRRLKESKLQPDTNETPETERSTPSPITPSTASTSITTPTSTPTSKPTPSARKSLLYARLTQKSAASSRAPPAGEKPKNPNDLKKCYTANQKSALSHLSSIISVLSLLSSSSGGRQAFSLPQLIRRIRDSSKSIIEDAVVREAICLLGGVALDAAGRVEAMTEEGLAPRFVKIVRIGEGVVGVVIDAAERQDDLQARVEETIERAERVG